MTYDEVQGVFDAQCGFGCHLDFDGDPAGGLDLRPTEACTNLIEVPSNVDPVWLRVKPGEADVSLLICKLDPYCILPDGSLHMPLGQDAMDTRAIEGIGGWIDEGAPGCAAADHVPPVFAGAEAAEGMPSAIQVGWASAVDDRTPTAALTYRVYEAASSGGQDFATPTLTTEAGATSATMGPLPNLATRFYVVRAIDEMGNEDGNVTEVSATTPANGDETPPEFAGIGDASPVGSSAAELSWSPATDEVTPSSAITYRAYVGTKAGDVDFEAHVATSEPGAIEILVTGLQSGTDYWFVVRASDAVGNENANTVEKRVTTGGAVHFTDDVEPIFADNCTGAGCHGGPHIAEEMDLSAGKAWDSIVDVPSNQCSDRLRVAPGNSSASYLADKLLGRNLCFGSQMPKTGGVTASEIQLVLDWIDGGALND